MSTSHLGLMIVFALFVSVVFASLMRVVLKEQLRFGGQVFRGFVIGGVALGWILYFFPL